MKEELAMMKDQRERDDYFPYKFSAMFQPEDGIVRDTE